MKAPTGASGRAKKPSGGRGSRGAALPTFAAPRRANLGKMYATYGTTIAASIVLRSFLVLALPAWMARLHGAVPGDGKSKYLRASRRCQARLAEGLPLFMLTYVSARTWGCVAQGSMRSSSMPFGGGCAV